MKRPLRYEWMRPKELLRVLEEAPAAYIPLGALEFHGSHLPFGVDAISAYEICRRTAVHTGGTILPPFYFGDTADYANAPGSIGHDTSWIASGVYRIGARLASMGFRVLVVLAGYSGKESPAAIQEAGRSLMTDFPETYVLALAASEAYPLEFRGDHAARWETSIAMHLLPEYVDLKSMEKQEDPLYGVQGEDPRIGASALAGRETVDGIVEVLSAQVLEALKGNRPKPPWYYGNRTNT